MLYNIMNRKVLFVISLFVVLLVFVLISEGRIDESFIDHDYCPSYDSQMSLDSQLVSDMKNGQQLSYQDAATYCTNRPRCIGFTQQLPSSNKSDYNSQTQKGVTHFYQAGKAVPVEDSSQVKLAVYLKDQKSREQPPCSSSFPLHDPYADRQLNYWKKQVYEDVPVDLAEMATVPEEYQKGSDAWVKFPSRKGSSGISVTDYMRTYLLEKGTTSDTSVPCLTLACLRQQVKQQLLFDTGYSKKQLDEMPDDELSTLSYFVTPKNLGVWNWKDRGCSTAQEVTADCYAEGIQYVDSNQSKWQSKNLYSNQEESEEVYDDGNSESNPNADYYYYESEKN